MQERQCGGVPKREGEGAVGGGARGEIAMVDGRTVGGGCAAGDSTTDGRGSGRGREVGGSVAVHRYTEVHGERLVGKEEVAMGEEQECTECGNMEEFPSFHYNRLIRCKITAECLTLQERRGEGGCFIKGG